VERVAVDHLTGLVTAGRASGGAPSAGGAGAAGGASTGGRTGAGKDAAPAPHAGVMSDSPRESLSCGAACAAFYHAESTCSASGALVALCSDAPIAGGCGGPACAAGAPRRGASVPG